MDFNKYIKELVKNQVQKSEHLQRAKGIIESINGNKITIKLISPIEQPSVTIVNNNGLELSVGQNVTVNHWGDVSKGYISFNSFEKFGGGVGQWLPIDPDNTTEIFNDYKNHSIKVFDSNSKLSGWNGNKKMFYGRMCGNHQTINIKSKSATLSCFSMSGSWNELNLGGLSDNTSNNCNANYIDIDGNSNNITNDNGSFRSIYVQGEYNTLQVKNGAETLKISGCNNTINVNKCYNCQTMIGYNHRIKVPGDIYDNTLIGNNNTLEISEVGGYTGYCYSYGYYNRVQVKNGMISRGLLLGADNQIYSNCDNACNVYESTIVGHRNKIEQNTAVELSRFEQMYSTSLFGCRNTHTMGAKNNNVTILGTCNDITSDTQAEDVIVGGCNNNIGGHTFYRSTIIGDENRTGTNANINIQYSTCIGYSNILNSTMEGVGVYGNQNTFSSSILQNCDIFGRSNNVEGATLKNSYIIGVNNRTNCLNNGSGYIGIVGENNSFYDNNSYASTKLIVGQGIALDYSKATNINNIAMALGYFDSHASLMQNGDLKVVGSISSNGADYAEDWEWADGNLNNEDRRGLFVTIADNGYHIKIANKGDEILGIVSSNPSVIGGGDNFQWRGKYLKDVFGDYIYEDVQVPITTQERKLVKNEYTDDDGVHHPPEYETVEIETGEYKTEKRRVLNPDYDDTLVYTNREYRPEHCYIAHLGKVVMVDDGTSEPNGYVTSADGGIATKSEAKTRARVLQRLDENHIRVWWE